MTFTIRRARPGDIVALTELIRASVSELQKADYSREQLDGALGSVFGVDRTLIEDGTYFVVESEGALAGCGGWSRRKTLFGSDHMNGPGRCIAGFGTGCREDPRVLRASVVCKAGRGVANSGYVRGSGRALRVHAA